MTFEEILPHLKNGERITRKCWYKGNFIFLVSGSEFKVNRPPLNEFYKAGTVINYQPHIDMKDKDGTIRPVVLETKDILGTDWMVLNEK